MPAGGFDHFEDEEVVLLDQPVVSDGARSVWAFGESAGAACAVLWISLNSPNFSAP